ncbi:hypothetical protein MASR2M12_07330 [Bacteroidales bacterium]
MPSAFKMDEEKDRNAMKLLRMIAKNSSMDEKDEKRFAHNSIFFRIV